MTRKLRIDEAVDLYGNIKRVKFQGYYHERSQIKIGHYWDTNEPYYHEDYFLFYDEDEVYHVEHKPTREVLIINYVAPFEKFDIFDFME